MRRKVKSIYYSLPSRLILNIWDKDVVKEELTKGEKIGVKWLDQLNLLGKNILF